MRQCDWPIYVATGGPLPNSWSRRKEEFFRFSYYPTAQSDPSTFIAILPLDPVRRTMETTLAKHVISSYEEDSLSDGSSPDDEKTIPFLR
jgi:hypothetical protein